MRNSHLDNAGYSFDQRLLVEREVSPEKLVDVLLTEERWRQVLSSLVVCFFARGIFTPDVVAELLKTAGFALREEGLQQLDNFIYLNKFRFKLRENFDVSNLSLPRRLYTTQSPVQQFDAQFIARALDHFKRVLEVEGKRFSQ